MKFNLNSEQIVNLILAAVGIFILVSFIRLALSEGADRGFAYQIGIWLTILFALAAVGRILYSYLANGRKLEAYKDVRLKHRLKKIHPSRISKFQYRLPLGFNLFHYGLGLGKFTNMYHGKIGPLEVTIFNYTYTTKAGRNPSRFSSDVACFQFDEPNLPAFTLYNETAWQKIRTLVGRKDINFANHPHFSKAYWLVGENEKVIRQIFTDEVLEKYEQIELPSVTEANDHALIYYRGSVGRDQRGMYLVLDEGLEIIKLLHQTMLHQTIKEQEKP